MPVLPGETPADQGVNVLRIDADGLVVVVHRAIIALAAVLERTIAEDPRKPAVLVPARRDGTPARGDRGVAGLLPADLCIVGGRGGHARDRD